MKFCTKLIAVIVLGCMLLSISACGDTHTDPSAETPSSETPTTEAPTTEAPTEPTTEAPTTEEPTEGDAVIDFNRGNVDGNTYTNYLMGVSCTLDDDWVIANDEQIAQQMGLTMDIFSGTKLEDLIEQFGVAMIFMASRDDGTSININLEKANSLITTQEDLNAAVDTLAAQLPAIFAASGIEATECVAENMTFCGIDHYGIHSSIGGAGVSVYQRQILLVAGSYIATITVTSTGSDGTQEILDLFAPL